MAKERRFEASLQFKLASFVSPMTRRMILGEPDYAPPELIGLVYEQVEAAGGWNAGSDDSLIFASTASYPSLTNRKEPTPAELKSIGLTQCPSNKLLKAMVQGCINLLNTGEIQKPAGKAEHTTLSGVAMRLGLNLQAAGTAPGQNPSRADIDAELAILSGKFGVPVRALTALVATESSFRQFDQSGAPLGNPNTSAIGLTQIVRDTAQLFGADYNRLGLEWKYNLEIGTIIFEDSYSHVWNRNVNDLRTLAARTYGMYHDGISNNSRSLYDPVQNAGLTGTSYEASYLSHYDAIGP